MTFSGAVDVSDWDDIGLVPEDIRLGSIGESIPEGGFSRKFRLFVEAPAASEVEGWWL